MSKLPETRKTIALPDDMWEEIETYRQEERFGTQTEAMRQLLNAALRRWKRTRAGNERDGS